MPFGLITPDIARLDEVLSTLAGWQRDDAPIQLHPGDIGWHRRFGADATAAALRIWVSDERMLAVGLLDSADVLRLTVAPQAWRDDDLARQVAADLGDPARGVLPAGRVSVEAPDGTLVRDLLDDAGWKAGEPWTPLSRSLAAPVDQTRLRIEVIEPGRESAFTAVHRSAWGSERFTDVSWRAMADGTGPDQVRCLLGFDAQGTAVAGATVWSAGVGRPGLLEPVGVHADHRGRGYGTAISLAAAAELRRRGSSVALVCTLSSLTTAVAAYRSAGFGRLAERLDRTRER